MQSLVAKITLYDEFKEHTLDSLDEFNLFKENTLKTLSAQSKINQTTQQTLETVQSEINKLASRKDLHNIAKELAAHSIRIDNCAKQNDLDAAKVEILKCLATLEDTQSQLHETNMNVRVLEADMINKASVEEVEKCVKHPVFDAKMTEIDAKLDRKTDRLITNQLSNKLLVRECLC